jgi:DNA-directed RNA polymerase subunit RPC12/RpoP
MDIVFKCPQCQVELEVDADAAGQSINCPQCNRSITIPAANAPGNRAPTPPPPPVGGTVAAAAPTVERRFSVPVTDKPSEPLIQKPLPSLEAQAQREGKKMTRVKTIRHSDCKEVGHDNFDATVTEFLNKIGDENIVSMTPINYSYVEMGTQKLLNDFGVMIVYRG